ncbi:hypothetical protein ACO1O0_007963 [Amphichorda felina]
MDSIEKLDIFYRARGGCCELSPDPEPTPAERDESRPSSPSSSDSDTSDGESTPKPQTEWLATTRRKRSTAGNRMKSMLANEEPDSDLELLFAEDEDDQGFSDVADDASDVHMDSSSDDEDEKNAGEDDLEGEKELERQAKERRAAQRKRKAQEAIPAKFRKKVRIDPTTPTATAAPAPRPKKKSERASWLPSAADMPTRASSRQTTRLSKEQLHAQMEEREARRLKQLEHMQKKAARMEALKKPPMTQEERLREAELVEKRNSKSLNRWEEAEKQREEERRAKLAALNERTLKGPVITFWSGTRQWKDGGLAKYVVMEEKPKRREKKPKDKDKDMGKANDKNAATDEKTGDVDVKETGGPSDRAVPAAQVEIEQPGKQEVSQEPEQKNSPAPKANMDDVAKASETSPPEPPNAPTPTSSSQPREGTPLMAMPPMPPPTTGLAAPALPPDANQTTTVSSESKPSGILAAPVLAAPPGFDAERTSSPTLNHQEPPKSNVLAPPNTSQSPHPPPPSSKLEPVEHVQKDAHLQPTQNEATSTEGAADKATSAAPSEAPEAPAADTTATRNTIIYQNFDENAIKDKTIQTQILFGRKMNKIASKSSPATVVKPDETKPSNLCSLEPPPAPLCVITNHPARYRDPKTGLPFYNTYAYREIQRLRRGDYRWSKLLGAWAGSGSYAAKGVPVRFLKPKVEDKEKEAKEGAEQKKPEESTADGTKESSVKTEEVQT